ncbi:MAG: histidine kinase [Acidobacteriales bacterium 59-55]|nr:histidine kinase [Terriglobales bacterium]OJV41140.1 MAG: histidine kinase [Acidobacteriales bacterium 59-55]
MVNHTKTPEEWLLEAEAEKCRGRFKIFLGYAPGVGKTYSMLSEGIRRRSRGEDVIIGVVNTHGRAGTAELASKLERVPQRDIEYKGHTFSEMDVDAILARTPQIALVDELAHTNIEGSRFQKRYEDVMLLLENCIDVLSTVNIQHVESLTPKVQALTGIVVREQVPDWVLNKADEIVIADLTPEALITRMRRGDIYPQERAERSLANFFRAGNLIALRELALQQVARAVDRSLHEYVKRHKLGSQWAIAEKVAVCVSVGPQALDLIARGARLANLLNADLYVLHVKSPRDVTPEGARALSTSLAFARDLGAKIVELSGDDTALSTASFVREERITQVFVGRSATQGFRSYMYHLAIHKFMAEAPHVDLHIISGDRS